MVKNPMEIKPCKNNIGAEIKIDLNKLNNEKIISLKKSLDSFGVIFFRNQNLSSGLISNLQKILGILLIIRC